MRARKIFEGLIGGFRVSLEEISAESTNAGPHHYGVSKTAWRAGAQILNKLSVDDALAVLDARAERSIERGDIEAARRWRDVMAVVHAIAADDAPSEYGPN
jgi:hypothetical protein